MSNAKKPTSNAKEKAVEAEIAAAKLTSNGTKKSFSMPCVKFTSVALKLCPLMLTSVAASRIIAWIYYRSEAELRQEKARMPDAERVKLLLK